VTARLWRAWLTVARKIGQLNARIALTVVYFVVVGPFALAVRWLSDPLTLHRAAGWEPLPPPGDGRQALDAVRQQF
jgi:hypothetical protein